MAVIMDKEQIKEVIPHRDPFLLIDEINELEVGKRVVATKYIKAEDFWFKGHFPEYPVTPGVLMIEMLAQAGAVVNRRCPRATVAALLPGPSSDRTYGVPDSKRTMRGFVFVSGKPSAECPYCVGRYSSVWSVSVRVIQKSQVRFCPVTVIE